MLIVWKTFFFSPLVQMHIVQVKYYLDSLYTFKKAQIKNMLSNISKDKGKYFSCR